MALIVCPECGKQVSDKASACPNCGCPISSIPETNHAEGTSGHIVITSVKPRRKFPVFVIILLLAAIGAGVYFLVLSPEAQAKRTYSEALALYNSGDYSEALSKFETLDAYSDSAELAVQCKYKLGISAMESFDWKTAEAYFSGLDYEDSNRMLTDCSFMVLLEESVLRRMEIVTKEASNHRSMVTTELAYLEDFRNASFYSATIGTQAKKYIKGLDQQLEGLSYDFYYEYQRDWYTGLVARYEALNKLYTDFQFMADNKDFIGEYINQLEYHQKWLKAFNALENGLGETRDPRSSSYYVEYYFVNNSDYTATMTFDVVFWKDAECKILLGSTFTTVEDIGPYEEFTVRVYVPEAAQSGGYYYNWSNYYNEIKVD